MLLDSAWSHPYSREVAAASAHLPAGTVKYFPPVARVDNVHGDRHLFCSCLPVAEYETDEVAEPVAA